MKRVKFDNWCKFFPSPLVQRLNLIFFIFQIYRVMFSSAVSGLGHTGYLACSTQWCQETGWPTSRRPHPNTAPLSSATPCVLTMSVPDTHMWDVAVLDLPPPVIVTSSVSSTSVVARYYLSPFCSTDRLPVHWLSKTVHCAMSWRCPAKVLRVDPTVQAADPHMKIGHNSSVLPPLSQPTTQCPCGSRLPQYLQG